MKQRKLWGFIPCILTFIILSGCGYRVIGGKASSNQGLSIPILKNTTTRPGLEEELTRALRQEVLNSGRIRLSPDHLATFQLSGTISTYELTPISFDANDLVAEYRFSIKTVFRLQNLGENRLIWEESFATKFEYRVSPNIVETEKARINALQKASRELAQELISIVLERLP